MNAWAAEADLDPARVVSNTFTMEWPPRSGRQQAFPEVDRAAWFPLDEARLKILSGQVPLLEQVRNLNSTNRCRFFGLRCVKRVAGPSGGRKE